MVVYEQIATAPPVVASAARPRPGPSWRSRVAMLTAYSMPMPIVIGSATKSRKLILRPSGAAEHEHRPAEAAHDGHEAVAVAADHEQHDEDRAEQRREGRVRPVGEHG